MKSKKLGSSSPVATNLLSETDDDFAKALHEDYCKNENIKLEKDQMAIPCKECISQE